MKLFVNYLNKGKYSYASRCRIYVKYGQYYLKVYYLFLGQCELSTWDFVKSGNVLNFSI